MLSVVLCVVFVVPQRVVRQASPPVQLDPSSVVVKQQQLKVFLEFVVHLIALWSLAWQGLWLPVAVMSEGSSLVLGCC